MADKKVHICPECRKQFEGWPNSIYCPECATARYKERQKRYSQRHRAKEAEKKKVARELAEKKPAEKINTISLLHNNAFVCEDFILCGTRGWYQDPSCENMPENADFEKLVAREAARLKLSLDAGKKLAESNPDKEMLVFLHFPPLWSGLRCEPILSLLRDYGIKRCYFGHIHGNYTAPASFEEGGVRFSLIAADFLNFAPRPILPDLFS